MFRFLFLLSVISPYPVVHGQDLVEVQTMGLPAGYVFQYVEAANFGDDQRLEIVVGGYSQATNKTEVSVFSNPAGTLTHTVTLTSQLQKGSFHVEDVNNDNLPDIIISALSDNATEAWLSNGSFSFNRIALFADGGNVIAFEDLDQDGLPEFVVADSTTFTGIKIYRLTANGWSLAKTIGDNRVSSLEVLDIDGDWRQELVVISTPQNGSPSVVIFRNQGGLNFSSEKIMDQASAITSGDVNHDGQTDLVLSKPGMGTFVMKSANGVLTSDRSISATPVKKVFTADFNLNGLMDFILLGMGSHAMVYDDQTLVDLDPDTIDETYVDIDQDGDLDLVQLGASEINVLRNDVTAVNAHPEAASNIVALSVPGRILISWDDAHDDLTAASGISYDVAIMTTGQTLLNPGFDLLSGRRFITRTGNSGLYNSVMLRSRSDQFEYSIQAIDNAIFAGPESMVTGTSSCAEINEQRIARRGQSGLIDAGFKAKWYSYIDGHIGEGSSLHYLPAENDTIVAVSDQPGDLCRDVTMFTFYDEEETGYIPERFSPNNDGNNDVLTVFGLSSATSFLMQIYNREGSLVFSSGDLEQARVAGWDGTANGKAQPAGVYYWKIDGETTAGTKILLNGKSSGSVVLTR